MEFRAFSFFSLKRLWNAVKVFSSFYLSIIIRKPINWGYPVFFFIEPTNRCNFQCPECASGTGELTRPLGFLSTQLYQKLIDEISPYSLYIQLYLQGEPYIHKQLTDLINYASSKKLYTALSTNGSFINEKNVEKVLLNAPDKLIFSLDGLDEISYQNYRIGGTFAHADKALRLLVETKRKLQLKKPFIELQFLVMKQNEHQVHNVVPYGRQIGVDKVTLKTIQVNSLAGAEHFLPSNTAYSRYHYDGQSFTMKSKMRNECFSLWQTSVMTWDGVIVPCCFDKDAQYRLGSLQNESFIDIWKAPIYQQFRQGILQNRKGLSMCTNCTSGLKRSIFETET